MKPEFAYVAENLLLRGGYRKTHFQADQTTLQSVSQMGNVYQKPVEELLIHCDNFIPTITWNRDLVSSPEVFYFQEFLLQSLVRQWLSLNTNLRIMFKSLDLKNFQIKDFEILAEKALPEGHIDILIKDSTPIGRSRQFILQVKTGLVQK